MDERFGERLRAAAFAHLDRIREASGGILTWQQLQSFTFEIAASR